MNKLLKKILILAGVFMLALSLAAPAFAADAPSQGEPAAQTESDEGSTIGLKAIAAGIAVGIAAAGGALPPPSPPRALPASPRRRARSAPP